LATPRPRSFAPASKTGQFNVCFCTLLRQGNWPFWRTLLIHFSVDLFPSCKVEAQTRFLSLYCLHFVASLVLKGSRCWSICPVLVSGTCCLTRSQSSLFGCWIPLSFKFCSKEKGYYKRNTGK
jgi:hypothetical protein